MRDRFDDDDDTVTSARPAFSRNDRIAIALIAIALVVNIAACFGAWSGAIGPIGNLVMLLVGSILLFWVTPFVFRRH